MKEERISGKQFEADKYRNKYSHYVCGYWTMHNVSNRQAINLGRMLDAREKKEEWTLWFVVRIVQRKKIFTISGLVEHLLYYNVIYVRKKTTVEYLRRGSEWNLN